MRTFEHFPKQSKCPICGKSDDKLCVLVSINGTQKDGIAEAQPFHLECIEVVWYKVKTINYDEYSILVQQFGDKS